MKITALHKNIVAASATAGFMYIPTKDAKKLETEGLIVSNPAMTQGDTIAVKPTEKLLAEVNGSNAAAAPAGDAPAEQPAKASVTLEDGVALPAISRQGLKGDVYPFAKMEVGQSFFIASTEKHPNPAKTLASTVSSATRRYATPHATETRTSKRGEVVPKLVPTKAFTIRAVEGGARVWRTA